MQKRKEIAISIIDPAMATSKTTHPIKTRIKHSKHINKIRSETKTNTNEVALSKLSKLGEEGDEKNADSIRSTFQRRIKLIQGIYREILTVSEKLKKLKNQPRKYKTHREKLSILQNEIVKVCSSLKLSSQLIESFLKQYRIGMISFQESKKHLDKLNKITGEQERIKKHLAQSNLRLVIMVAKKYVSAKNDLSDLVQEGNLGLMKAIELYNYKTGFKFSTYATWWIKQAITRYLAEKSKTIRIPSNILERNRSIYKYSQNYLQNNFREPSADEIARGMGLSREKVCQSLENSGDPISLDTPFHDPDEPLINSVSNPSAILPEADFEENEVISDIESGISRLSDKEREVIIHRYGLFNQKAETLQEIGEQMKISRERVRQLEAKALAKLKVMKPIQHHAFV